jgi:acetyltransferase-like isoleucine patch superfamily enzyme
VLQVAAPPIARREKGRARAVKAIHGLGEAVLGPQFELDLAADLQGRLNNEQLLGAFTQYTVGVGYIDVLTRRISLHAPVKELGSGATIRRNLSIIHPEKFKIGDRVFVGEPTIIQGRFDGRCVVGVGVWIGPQSDFNAGDLLIEDHVGWGPGAKGLGSEHTGLPRLCAGLGLAMRILKEEVYRCRLVRTFS